jgi:hypothetical protein
MRILLTILLFATLSAKSQVLFVPGTTYKMGWVVYYPTNVKSNYYKSKPLSFVAKSTPDIDSDNWIRMYPDIITPPTQNIPPQVSTGVAQSSFDSLLNVFNTVSKRLQSIESKALLDTMVSTYKISLHGASMFRLIDPKTFGIKSLVESPTIGFTVTDSTIMPYLKQVKTTTTKTAITAKPSIIQRKKATVKK